LRDLDLLPRERDPRLERLDLRLRRIDFRPSNDLLLDQLVETVVLPLGLTQPRFILGRGAARRVQLSLGDGQRRTDLRVVQAGEDLALLDRLPLLDEDLEDLARHLRRDGGPAAGCDVSRRVQHCSGRRPGAAGCRDRTELDRGGLGALRPEPPAGRNGGEHNRGPDHQSASPATSGPGILVDFERSQFVF